MFCIGILGGVAKRSISLSVLCPLTHTLTRSQLNWSSGVVLMWLCTFWEFLLKSHPRIQKWTLDIGKRQYHNQLQLRLVKKLQWVRSLVLSQQLSEPPTKLWTQDVLFFLRISSILQRLQRCRISKNIENIKTLENSMNERSWQRKNRVNPGPLEFLVKEDTRPR